MSDVNQVITECKAVIRSMELKFGCLVVVELPPTVTEKSDEIVTRLNNWWITQSPYFKGAKMMVCKHGAKVGLQTDDGLRAVGYVHLDAVVGDGPLTVRQILTNHMNGITHEEVAVSGQGTSHPLDRD